MITITHVKIFDSVMYNGDILAMIRDVNKFCDEHVVLTIKHDVKARHTDLFEDCLVHSVFIEYERDGYR